MEIVTIKVKCCKEPEAEMVMNKAGLLHYRCAYCGFELHAGSEYNASYSPRHGVVVVGQKP